MIAPMVIRFGTEEYIDGITMSHEEFYERLSRQDVMPTTSQVTPAAFGDMFAQEAPNAEALVVITLASNLSGTYQSAVIAAEDYDNVYVVDSRTVSIGAGALAMLALELANQGKDGKTIVECLEQQRDRIRLVAVLDTLEYLKQGGRISKTAALAGGLLNIKPVISCQDGVVSMAGKARGAKQGNALLTQLVEKTGGVDTEMPVILGYSGFSDASMCKYAEETQGMWGAEPGKASLGSVVGTHAGPGAYGVAYFCR